MRFGVVGAVALAVGGVWFWPQISERIGMDHPTRAADSTQITEPVLRSPQFDADYARAKRPKLRKHDV